MWSDPALLLTNVKLSAAVHGGSNACTTLPSSLISTPVPSADAWLTDTPPSIVCEFIARGSGDSAFTEVSTCMF